MRRILLVVLAAAVVAAPAGVAETKPVHRYSVPGYATSLELPSSWKAVDYRQVVTSGELKKLARENPDLAGTFAAMAQPGSPIKLFAFDPQVANGFATNLNVVVIPIRSPLTFARYRNNLVAEVRSLAGVADLRSNAVRLPGGRAVHLTYRLTFTFGGQKVTAQTNQYGFLRPSRTEVFTYTTLPGTAPFYSSVFTASARSIRIAG